MIALPLQRLPLLAPLAGVLRGWTWRDTLTGVALGVFNVVLGPAGGLLFFPAPDKEYGSALLFNTLMFGLPIVLAVRLADRAADRGVPALRAYGSAVIAVAAGGSWLGWLLGLSLWNGQLATQARNVWVTLAIASLYGLGVAAYVQWRRAQQRLARLHRSELERAQQEQQLQVQRLLALQARVEPQLLFDTLRRVLDQVPSDPAAADALLAELIAMLRAMLPGAGAPSSTVAREFALLRSYAAVSGSAPPRLRVLAELEADVEAAEVAPMLVLPLLRLLRDALPAGAPIVVSAALQGDRLRLSFVADPVTGGAACGDVSATPEWGALRQRVSALYGGSADLQCAAGPPPSLSLELPYRHDDRADR